MGALSPLLLLWQRIWEFPFFILGLILCFRLRLKTNALARSFKGEPRTEQRKRGSKFAMESLYTWRSLVLTGRGKTAVSRLNTLVDQRGLLVGDVAPDCVLHRFGNLEKVNISAFFRPGRLTLLTFGSYT